MHELNYNDKLKQLGLMRLQGRRMKSSEAQASVPAASSWVRDRVSE